MPKGEGVCLSCGEYLWDCECKSKLVKYKAALVKALDALEKIKEMTAIVDRKKAEDLIPEIYHIAREIVG